MTEALDVLYEAYSAKIGIRVRITDPQRARAALYSARTKDPDLGVLSIQTSPFDPRELYIVKKDVYDAYKRDRKEDPPLPEGGLGISD